MPAQVNIAKFEFDLEADFTPTFADWNTKQVVCYLVFTYESSNHIRNEITIWDRIIKSTRSFHHPSLFCNTCVGETNQKVQLTDAKAKYNVVDVWDGMVGSKRASLELRWNVVPWMGILTEHNKIVKDQIVMPEGPPKNIYNYDKFAAN